MCDQCLWYTCFSVLWIWKQTTHLQQTSILQWVGQFVVGHLCIFWISFITCNLLSWRWIIKTLDTLWLTVNISIKAHRHNNLHLHSLSTRCRSNAKIVSSRKDRVIHLRLSSKTRTSSVKKEFKCFRVTWCYNHKGSLKKDSQRAVFMILKERSAFVHLPPVCIWLGTAASSAPGLNHTEKLMKLIF